MQLGVPALCSSPRAQAWQNGREPPGPAKCSAPSKELQLSTVFGRRRPGALKNLMESCSKPLGSGLCWSLKAAGLLGGETEALPVHPPGRDEPRLLVDNHVAIGSCLLPAATAHPTAQGGKYSPPTPPRHQPWFPREQRPSSS